MLPKFKTIKEGLMLTVCQGPFKVLWRPGVDLKEAILRAKLKVNS